MKDILVSFNNTYQSPGYPSLGLIKGNSLDLQIIDLPPHIPRSGFLGLASSSKYVYAGLQYAFDATIAYRIPPEIGLQYSHDGLLESLNPCSLLVFDKENFSLLNQYYFNIVQDVHSFLLEDDEKTLYVVSTGTDELIKITLDGINVIDEKVIWRPGTAYERKDNHHLNSICKWNGDLIISGFGKKKIADDWNSAKNGFIYNVSKEHFLKSGLQQPHSLAVIEKNLAYCESKEKRVRFVNRHDSIDVDGYSRGLCVIDNEVFIGISARRQKSKSTGKINKPDTYQSAGCGIIKITTGTMSERIRIDLNNAGHEIYELLPVSDTNKWPIQRAKNYRQHFEEAWERQRNNALHEIQNFQCSCDAIIIVDDNALGFIKNDFPEKEIYAFIEKEGMYWGPPADDQEAIDTLEQLKKKHPSLCIVFLWPSLWWLESYPLFNRYLQSHFNCKLKNERLNMFSGNE